MSVFVCMCILLLWLATHWSINFKKYQRETVIQVDSPTYKLIHGDEAEAPKKSRPPPLEKEPESTPVFPRLKPTGKVAAPAAPAQPPQQGGQSGDAPPLHSSAPFFTQHLCYPSAVVEFHLLCPSWCWYAYWSAMHVSQPPHLLKGNASSVGWGGLMWCFLVKEFSHYMVWCVTVWVCVFIIIFYCMNLLISPFPFFFLLLPAPPPPPPHLTTSTTVAAR